MRVPVSLTEREKKIPANEGLRASCAPVGGLPCEQLPIPIEAAADALAEFRAYVQSRTPVDPYDPADAPIPY